MLPNEARGVTLVELLAALALLSLIAVAGSGWIATTARAQVAIGRVLDFESAADAALARIREDILRGDGPAYERVRIQDGTLIVQTRSLHASERGRAVERAYRHSPQQKALVVTERMLAGRERQSLLVAGVQTMRFQVVHDETGWTVEAAFQSTSGQSRQWSLRLP